MKLGKKIKVINKDKKQLFASLSLISVLIVVINAIWRLHMNKEIDFIVGKYEILIIIALLFLSILSVVITFQKWPKYSFVLYRQGFKAIRKNNESYIDFNEIEDMLVIPQKSNLGIKIIALAFKTEKSPWMILSHGHKSGDLSLFKETYENYIYASFMERLKKGEEISFKYINNNLIDKKVVVKKEKIKSKIEEFEDNKKSIVLNIDKIQFNTDTYPLTEIEGMFVSKDDKMEIIDKEEIVVFEFNKYTISNEDIFKMLLKQLIA